MNNPITIVIPAYNRAQTLARTLRSIGGQTVAPARVILVDNGSTDSSLRLMEEWASRQSRMEVLVLSESKRGACAARNRGLQEVETEFVMFFDSDDEMQPSHVADFTDAISRHPDTDIFGRDIITVGLDGKRRTLYFSDRDVMFSHLFRGCLSTQRMVVRTSLVREAGGWNEDIPVWNDFELGARLLLASNRVRQLGGAPSVVTYQQAQSITGTSFKEKAGLWERTLDRMEAVFTENGRQDLVKWLDCRRMILAAHYRMEGAPELSDRLHADVVAKGRSPRRLKLVYAHNLRFRRLTWVFARFLFLFS